MFLRWTFSIAEHTADVPLAPYQSSTQVIDNGNSAWRPDYRQQKNLVGARLPSALPCEPATRTPQRHCPIGGNIERAERIRHKKATLGL